MPLAPLSSRLERADFRRRQARGLARTRRESGGGRVGRALHVRGAAGGRVGARARGRRPAWSPRGRTADAQVQGDARGPALRAEASLILAFLVLS